MMMTKKTMEVNGAENGCSLVHKTNGFKPDHKSSSSHTNGIKKVNGNTCSEDTGLYDMLKSVVLKLEDMQHQSSKVVEFLDPVKVPEKLMESTGSSSSSSMVISDEGISEDELRTIVDTTFRYSVKTGHRHFYNALYHGVDTIGQVGNFLSEALNTAAYTHEVAPVFTAAEREVVKHLGQKIGWPESQVDGITCPGGSMANLCAIVMARHHKNPSLKSTGISGVRPLVVYYSAEAHYSVQKGANWLGIGLDNVVSVPTNDATGAMIPGELVKAIRKTLAEGKEPLMINATGGTTIRGGFDDFEALASVAKEFGIWLHGDLALGGAALFGLPETKDRTLRGIHLADSVTYNPHKLLGAPLQSSFILTRHPDSLKETNCTQATYLFQQDKFYDVTYDSGDKSVQCGRKVDSFKTWLMMKARGDLYFCDLVENAFKVARIMAERIERKSEPGFRLVLQQSCSNVCFVYIPPCLRDLPEDEEWKERLSKVAPIIKEKMMRQGTLMVAYQPLKCKGLKNFFRMVFHCVPKPTEDDVNYILNEIRRLGDEITSV